MRVIISKNNPFGTNRYGFLWEKLNELPVEKHLDYGAFDGLALKKLIESNVIREGIGVDINKRIIEKAKTNMPEGITLITIEKGLGLPFRDQAFDSISILDVIEHIYNQKSVLTELNRVLRVGGKIVITVPRKHLFSFLDTGNLKFIFPRFHKLYYQLIHSKEKYVRRYEICEHGLFGDIELEKMWHQHFSNSELEVLLKNSGFVDVEFDGAGFFSRPLGLLPLMFPFAKSFFSELSLIDSRVFESANCFAIATKK